MQRKARIIYHLQYARAVDRTKALRQAEDEWLDLVSQGETRVGPDFSLRHGKVGEKSTGALIKGLIDTGKRMLTLGKGA